MADDEVVDEINQRYQRRELIGHGAFKTVYKAYDTEEGIEVAWNQVRLTGVQPQQRAKILGEITILEQLKHQNIMDIYDSWETPNGDFLVFITEIMSSGTLKTFLRRAKRVKLKSIKKWCKQILNGLHYLHSHDPPVIHRDLKCDNIFMNGNRGEVKIGDLGLSICMKDKKFAVSVIGTPEFMAPELYAELYDEKIDIYAFGMCLLEMVTGEYPYCECENAAQIFMKVINGVKPASMKLVTHKSVKEFIDLCTDHKDKRPSALQLLEHPFMQPNPVDDNVVFYFNTPSDAPVNSQNITPNFTTVPQTIQQSKKSIAPQDTPRVTLQSDKPNPDGSVFMKLYYKIRGTFKEIKFQFNLTEDTPEDVAYEMVIELELSDADVEYISKGIHDALHNANLKIARQYIPLEVDIEDPNAQKKLNSPLKDKDAQASGQSDLQHVDNITVAAGEGKPTTSSTVTANNQGASAVNPAIAMKPPQDQAVKPNAQQPTVTPAAQPDAIDSFLSDTQQSPTPHPTHEEIVKLWTALYHKQEKEEMELKDRHRREREEFKKKYKFEPVVQHASGTLGNQGPFSSNSVQKHNPQPVQLQQPNPDAKKPTTMNGVASQQNPSANNAMSKPVQQQQPVQQKPNNPPVAQPVSQKAPDLMVLISKNLDSLMSNAPATPMPGGQSSAKPVVSNASIQPAAKNTVPSAVNVAQPIVNGNNGSPSSISNGAAKPASVAAVPPSSGVPVAASNGVALAQQTKPAPINANGVMPVSSAATIAQLQTSPPTPQNIPTQKFGNNEASLLGLGQFSAAAQ